VDGVDDVDDSDDLDAGDDSDEEDPAESDLSLELLAPPSPSPLSGEPELDLADWSPRFPLEPERLSVL